MTQTEISLEVKQNIRSHRDLIGFVDLKFNSLASDFETQQNGYMQSVHMCQQNNIGFLKASSTSKFLTPMIRDDASSMMCLYLTPCCQVISSMSCSWSFHTLVSRLVFPFFKLTNRYMSDFYCLEALAKTHKMLYIETVRQATSVWSTGYVRLHNPIR
jgi:hypothetical protein